MCKKKNVNLLNILKKNKKKLKNNRKLIKNKIKINILYF